jgi:hypothetical protein
MGKRRSVAVIANEVLVLDGGVLRRALLRSKNGGEASEVCFLGCGVLAP